MTKSVDALVFTCLHQLAKREQIKDWRFLF